MARKVGIGQLAKGYQIGHGLTKMALNMLRGPHGAGKVYTEMFRNKVDNQWKFTYLIVDIKSPSPTQIMLESYVPA